jgi:DNA polymerase
MKELIGWYADIGVDEVIGNVPLDRGEIRLLCRSRELADRADSLADLRERVLDFDDCALKKMAHSTVFADGNSQADVMLVGEAPGAQEDEQGIPFCGESGRLLDNMLATIGLNRKNVYITNTIFWRPPGNRKPTVEELALCLPFVEKHIALVNPKILVLVGATALNALLRDNSPITGMRGKVHKYSNRYMQGHELQTIVFFHPSYLLRQPLQKRAAWYDLLFLKKLCDAAGVK